MAYRTQRVEKIIERELANIIFTEVHNELIKFVSIFLVCMVICLLVLDKTANSSFDI